VEKTSNGVRAGPSAGPRVAGKPGGSADGAGAAGQTGGRGPGNREVVLEEHDKRCEAGIRVGGREEHVRVGEVVFRDDVRVT
jgi:hypothetical protein